MWRLPFGLPGSKGSVWAPALAGAALCASLSAQTITEFSVPSFGQPGGIASGPDGNLWLTDLVANRIGRVTTSGALTGFTLPGSGSLPRGIASGPDGNLWFTEEGTNRIGRITPAGAIAEFAIPTPGAEPFGITAGPDGALWFTEFGFGANKIGRITTSGVFTEFPIPTVGARPRGIAAGPDGNLWFTERSDRIGRITPSGAVTEFPVPTQGGEPYGISPGPDGNLWFTESFGNRIGRITPSGAITEFALPTQNSNPEAMTAGPDGNIWFTESGNERIGRIKTGSCAQTGTSLCLNNNRFRVEAAWRSATASGPASAVRLTGESGYFWFFNPDSIEAVVKVLNGGSLNARYWVFAAGLTNVEVTVTVTDIQTGAIQTYFNPLNTAIQPIQDTLAFATCP